MNWKETLIYIACNADLRAVDKKSELTARDLYIDSAGRIRLLHPKGARLTDLPDS